MPWIITYINPEDKVTECLVPISKADQEAIYPDLKRVNVKLRDVKAHYPKLKLRVYHVELWEER